ncbi:YbaY family lipoprotein [Uliginosibacterium sp. H3]|uniref:YbaY family lipoprotein n=1 Tax=Uliginosibacterium silvisoli TaxID=3114758 RepID=A0ABU6K5V0_9RHOO|nr:YbaY family lipoprotein [Uliginosibacterium sp. H3]
MHSLLSSRPLRTCGLYIACALSGLFLIAACASTVAPASSISGTASYRERIALPPDAVFEASIEDVSRADARAELVGSVRQESPGQPPFRFTISYDPARIVAGHRYVVRARISQGGKLLFTSDTAYPVLVPGQADNPQLLLRPVGGAPVAAAVTASFENTYWKLTRLGSTSVEVATSQPEAHLIFQGPQKRVIGATGCNRLSGSYTLDGSRLALGETASTRMACLQGMALESSFLQALSRVASWRVTGEQMELLDASGVSLARFESRYMQ